MGSSARGIRAGLVVCLVLTLTSSLLWLPAQATAPGARLRVETHSAASSPSDFLVADSATGAARPYLLFDEGVPGAPRVRVRIKAATPAGYQDFIFDGASQSVSIRSGSQTLLGRATLRLEERRGPGAWQRVALRNPHLSYTRHDRYAEVMLSQDVASGGSVSLVARLGFDGTSVIHTVQVTASGPGGAGAMRRAWLRLEGLPGPVANQTFAPAPAAADDGADDPLALSYGPLQVEWLGPQAGPAGVASAADRSLELGPSAAGTSGTSAMTLSLGATVSSTTVTVTAPTFKLVFDASRGGGIAAWYDLTRDPGATQNLVYKNSNLVADRIKVAGTYYATNVRDNPTATVSLVSQDGVKAVVRQSGTYFSGSAVLSGATFTITYTVWLNGQVGINLSTQSSQSQVVDVEERQLKVSSGAWTAIDQFRTVTSNQAGDKSSEYVGFTSSGADAVLVQYQTWAANLIAFKSGSAGQSISWRRTADTTWAAGSTRNDAFLLLLRPDTLDSFSAPLPYADDYRCPSVSVSQGTDQGFDPAAAAYRFGANSSSQVSFSFGGSLARYLPRFIVTGYTASTWTVTLNGSVLSEGSDYVAAYDPGSATLSIQYVDGSIPAGSQVGIVPQAGTQTPTITSVTPPATLHVTDESPDGFDIPYIQESRTLHVAASASGVPSGGGIEFVLDGASTFDMTAPFAADLAAGDGEHTLDVYIVDSSKKRLSNPEAHARRAQIGIGWMWSAIGDSITAGKFGDSTPGPVTNCSQDTTTGKSADCRNFFQTYPDGSPPTFVYYHGYEPHLNDCLTEATGRATFLMNEGIGGYTSRNVLNNMSAYTQRIQQLGISHVLLLIGTNDANQGVAPSTWQSNVEGIINALKSAGVPAGNIWVGYVPYRKGSSTGAQEARQLIQQYNALLPAIKADTEVNIGPDFYTYFENHQSLFADNLHPNQTGYNAMGDLWARSIVPSETVCTAP